MNKHKEQQSGFSLVEVLVTMAVVGLLGAVTVTAVGTVREGAHKASDVASARQLAAAYMMYPQDNRGKLMPAKPSQVQQQMDVVYDIYGDPITVPAVANRYVFRLLPYTDSVDLMYPGPSQAHYQEILERGNVYDLSLFPSFGINHEYLGGDYTHPRYNPDNGSRVALTHVAQCINPSEQIVFISTFYTGSGRSDAAPYIGQVNAYAPKGLRSTWSSYDEEYSSNTGNVHLRYNGEAVVAHLDGSVAMLGEEELKDMRRWSNQARDTNNPNLKPR